MSIYFKRLKEPDVAAHSGIFHKQLSLFQGTALITSGTIGAGILGIPHVVSRVGLGIGVVYIVCIGLLMMCLNLLIADVVIATRQNMQVAGLARHYLGRFGGTVVTTLSYSLLFGVLMVYMIGEGETLSALFGGSAFWWSMIFFLVATLFIVVGMRTVKTIELALSFGLLAILFLFVLLGSPHVDITNWSYHNFANIFLPYGVILFSFHATTAIPEAHSLLINKDKTLKKAIATAGIISMIVYVMFATIVVGVTGLSTTQIATIGLGQAIGKPVFIIGNLFAAFAMATSFLMAGMGLRDSLRWDFRLPSVAASVLVCVVPFLAFIIGTHTFISAINIVGGVFMSIELICILLIYREAKKRGDIDHTHLHRVGFHASAPILMALMCAFSVGAIYSVLNLL